MSAGMRLTWETDEITSYLRIPNGYTIAINGDAYVLTEQDDQGLTVRTWEERDGVEYIGKDDRRFEYDDIETLHIY
jgi:hypothetical protein